ncbi:MAG: J domain-containing protein [Bacteroidota bacterium]
MELFFVNAAFTLSLDLPGREQYVVLQEKESSSSGAIILISLALPFVAACLFFLYKYIQNRKWTTGVFPFDLPANAENLLEAYMSITAHFILLDRYRQMEKVSYLKSYFMRHYSTTPVNIRDSMQRNFHYPIRAESAASWVNRYFSTDTKKQLVQFLVGLSHVDGTLNREEYEALKSVVSVLQLELSFLDAAIHLYKEQKKSPKKKAALRTSEKQKCALTLGVPENADKKEIKQRFRELAKQHHPDRYSKNTKEQQEMAHKRFLEIQRAYEYLMKSD